MSNYQATYEAFSTLLHNIFIQMSFVIMVTSFAFNTYREHNNQALIKRLGFYFLVVVLIAYCKPFSLALDGFLSNLRSDIAADTDKLMQNLQNSIEVEGSDDWYAVAEGITSVIFKGCTVIGTVVRWFIQWLQQIILSVMIILSPLCISLLTFQATQTTGTKFLLGILGVCLFHIAFNIADFIILLGMSGILQLSAIGGAQAGGTVLGSMLMGASFAPVAIGAALMLGIGLIFLIFATYVCTPVFIYALLRGDNAMTAAVQAMNMASNTMNMLSQSMQKSGAVGGQVLKGSGKIANTGRAGVRSALNAGMIGLRSALNPTSALNHVRKGVAAKVGETGKGVATKAGKTAGSMKAKVQAFKKNANTPIGSSSPKSSSTNSPSSNTKK